MAGHTPHANTAKGRYARLDLVKSRLAEQTTPWAAQRLNAPPKQRLARIFGTQEEVAAHEDYFIGFEEVGGLMEEIIQPADYIKCYELAKGAADATQSSGGRRVRLPRSGVRLGLESTSCCTKPGAVANRNKGTSGSSALRSTPTARSGREHCRGSARAETRLRGRPFATGSCRLWSGDQARKRGCRSTTG